MGNSFMSVAKEPERELELEIEQEREPKREIVTLPRHSQRTIDIPLRRVRTITHITHKSDKSLTCILCNKTLNISNTDHHCKIRPCIDEFSIKFN